MNQKTIIKQALSAAEHPILLESVKQLESAAQQWCDSDILGIDTEFVRERTYRADLGLVQVSDGKSAWLVDPILVSSLEPLTDLMNQSAITKILHSGSEDLEVLLNVLGAQPEPLVDTQVACAMLGQPLQLGYHHAVKWLLDVDIDKDQTRSKWLKRPLNSNQLRYAAMDVVLLPIMYEILELRLRETGRLGWLKEDINRMISDSLNVLDPEEAYLRFTVTGRMDQPSLRVLKSLATWREVTARERNLARGFVITDAALLQLGRLRPSCIEEVRAIEEIHVNTLTKHGEILVELIAEANVRQTPVTRLEEFSRAQKIRLNNMRKCVRKSAQKLGVDPALLASKRELEKLVRALDTGDAIPERFLGWRKQIITNELLDLPA